MSASNTPSAARNQDEPRGQDDEYGLTGLRVTPYKIDPLPERPTGGGDVPPATQSPRRGGSGGPTQLRQRAGGGETNEWYTPPEIFHALGCDFDLDVAAPPGGVDWIPARRHYSYRDDGLGQPWQGRVWLNPPYGPHTAPWLGKLAQHGNGIALVFARTDVTWFHTIAQAASLICFLRGRVRFVRAVGIERNGHNAAAPSCLMAFGDECAEIVRTSGLGLCGVLA